jgi:hypothetical protein
MALKLNYCWGWQTGSLKEIKSRKEIVDAELSVG